MITGRLHAPEEIIDAEGHPAERLIMTHIKCREHPFELRPAEPAIGQVFRHCGVIVPIDEIVPERGQKDRSGRDYDENRNRAPNDFLLWTCHGSTVGAAKRSKLSFAAAKPGWSFSACLNSSAA